jgi:hypothetical protein
MKMRIYTHMDGRREGRKEGRTNRIEGRKDGKQGTKEGRIGEEGITYSGENKNIYAYGRRERRKDEGQETGNEGRKD